MDHILTSLDKLVIAMAISAVLIGYYSWIYDTVQTMNRFIEENKIQHDDLD